MSLHQSRPSIRSTTMISTMRAFFFFGLVSEANGLATPHGTPAWRLYSTLGSSSSVEQEQNRRNHEGTSIDASTTLMASNTYLGSTSSTAAASAARPSVLPTAPSQIPACFLPGAPATGYIPPMELPPAAEEDDRTAWAAPVENGGVSPPPEFLLNNGEQGHNGKSLRISQQLLDACTRINKNLPAHAPREGQKGPLSEASTSPSNSPSDPEHQNRAFLGRRLQ
ncbi:unnamed protein product [Amoebophrya sp. A120]|nr:unnamed protein product [Amoebophrya sp. A120]|eukprot:GSA120T00020787001.1